MRLHIGFLFVLTLWVSSGSTVVRAQAAEPPAATPAPAEPPAAGTPSPAPPAAAPAVPVTPAPLSTPAAVPLPAAPAEPAPAPVEPAPTPAPEAQPVAAPAPEAPAHVPATPPPPPPERRQSLGDNTVVEGWTPETPRVRSPYTYKGFSVRLSAELGLGRADRDRPGRPVQISGLAGGINVDVGSALSDDLIVFGRLGGFAFNHGNPSDTPDAGTVYVATLGPGARYHFMPFDWYGSGALSLALMSVTSDRGKVENAAPGFGLQLETGKNWFTGVKDDRSFVGLGLRFSYVRCGSVGDIDEPWVVMALSVVFSMAYN